MDKSMVSPFLTYGVYMVSMYESVTVPLLSANP